LRLAQQIAADPAAGRRERAGFVGDRLAAFVQQGRQEDEAMPTPFPHHYDATLNWNGSGPAAIGCEGRPSIAGGAPPEFDGEPGRWSPEHLLLASLNLCLQATFEAIAKKKGLQVATYRSHASATLAPVPDGIGFTYLALEVAIGARPEDHERLRDALTAAKHHCIVARALNAPVHMSLTLVSSPLPTVLH
jgi:organic hydroperoxide reductase OsmC/OhrA